MSQVELGVPNNKGHIESETPNRNSRFDRKLMITILGSSNIDFISHNDHLPLPGETVIGKNFIVTPGGKGANQAVAVARLGGKVRFLSKIGGKDKYADILLEGFRWAGVDYSCVEVEADTYCGIALIMVGEKAQNIISVIANANACITKDFLEKHRKLIESSKIIVTEFGIPIETAEHAALMAKAAGCCTIINPAPAVEIRDQFYDAIDIITPNETEASILTGYHVKDTESTISAAEFFHKKGVENVVITLGRNGVYISTSKKKEWIPIFQVNAIDTTAAGDAFNGGLACALWEGKDIFNASRFGSAVAALCVTKSGSSRAMPSRQEVNSFLKKNNILSSQKHCEIRQ